MTTTIEALQDATGAAQDAVEALEMLSVKLEAIGTKNAKRIALEARNAAKVAAAWSLELIDQHRAITKAKP